MKVTKVEEQGIRLTMRLAQNGGQLTLPELAANERLSEALVAKIMGKLRRGGVVRAIRGRDGRYELAAAPDSLTLAGILRSLGRPLVEGCFNTGCQSGEQTCSRVTDCGLRPVWERLSDEVTWVLDRITLSELIQQERVVRASLKSLHRGQDKPE